MQRSNRFCIRGSVFPSLTAGAIVFTSSLSVALTYAWQAKWRKLEGIPFVSDAHYDSKQSPIFSVMLCLTAILFVLNVFVTFASVSNAYFRHSNEADESSIPKFRRLARISLFAGSLTAIFMGCISAFYTDLRIHSVAVGLTALGFAIWSTCMVMALRLVSGPESATQKASYWVLPICLLTLVGILLSMVVLLVYEAFLPIALLEYVSLGVVALFLTVLGYVVHPYELAVTIGDAQ